MFYTVNLKWLSFKQNISDFNAMLDDEKSTYVIMKYAMDIPQRVYMTTMEYLIEVKSMLTYDKLIKLISQYESSSSVNMTMDEEFVETIEIEIPTKW